MQISRALRRACDNPSTGDWVLTWVLLTQVMRVLRVLLLSWSWPFSSALMGAWKSHLSVFLHETMAKTGLKGQITVCIAHRENRSGV
jgi:hypothetical protein